jgi:hypothetical protein
MNNNLQHPAWESGVKLLRPTISFEDDEIVVFVGPNNAGNSRMIFFQASG